ncbi:hypothetical protein AB0J71_16750 [Nonomuraea sp. NPDC049637]|uniref:hypothetical protein n=1 Tax=Nonomuraea sp. NPDC049637 TaxID=3154356 RepID=UPI003445FA73
MTRNMVIPVGRPAALVAALTAAVLGVLVVSGWWAGAASASSRGGWAVTYLDPPPAAFAGGKTYTVGFWVLQHGTHPYAGELDPVGLRLTRADGRSVTFPGTPLPEAGHYATSVAVPDGVWRVEGLQGWFEPYAVGTLTVPGRLLADPVPPDKVATFGGDGKDPWGAVRPPGFAPGKSTPAPPGEPTGTQAGGPTGTQPEVQAGMEAGGGAAGSAAARVPAGEAPGGGVPAYLLAPAAVAGALVALVASRLPRLRGTPGRPGRAERPAGARRNAAAADPPDEDGSTETLVIGGQRRQDRSGMTTVTGAPEADDGDM